MSSVYCRRRPDGTRAQIFSVDIWVDGERTTRSTGVKTRREAEKAAAAIEAELRAERRRKHEPMTMEAAMAKYWLDYASELPSALSVKYHLLRLKQILPPGLPLAAFGNSHVSDYAAKRKVALVVSRAKDPKKRKPPRCVSPATVNRELDVLQAIHSMARDTWEHPVRPVNWGKYRLELPQRRRRTFSEEESERAIALAATKSRDVADALAFSIYTGMRKNELETLVPARVNLKERFCTVLAKRKAKQGYRERTVFLSTDALSILAERITLGMDPDVPLFNITNGRKIWEWVRAQVGRPEMRWHDLRHTHASMLGKATKDPLVVQKQLGHTHVTTSMGYIHTADAQAIEAVDLLPVLRKRPKVVTLRPDAPRPDAANEAEPPSSATIIKPATGKGA